MGDATGTTVELEITNVAHGGVFVARHDGRVVFVSDAIPGERVLARITDDSKPKFWRAETVGVVEASPHRRAHVWASAGIDRDPADRAGGAEFGHIELGHQRELKARVLTDALERMAPGVHSGSVIVEAAPGDDAAGGLGWRTRVRLQVAPDGSVGPYASRSHTVIDVPDLPLAIAELAEAAPLGQRFEGAESVDIVAPSTGGAYLTVNPAAPARARNPRGQGQTGRGQARGKRPAPTRATRPAGEPRLIRERVGDREFQVAAQGFWQVHRAAAETLTEAVVTALDPQLFDPQAANLDLYGGVGLFAAALGDKFGTSTKITSVESDEQATDAAAENLADWLGAQTVTARVDRYLAGLLSSAGAAERGRLAHGAVVLDPPRSGAGKEVVGQLAQLSPAQVVYVACDPVALARDLALFEGHGYRLAQLRAFDLFPHTHHLEAVATLVPVKPAH